MSVRPVGEFTAAVSGGQLAVNHWPGQGPARCPRHHGERAQLRGARRRAGRPPGRRPGPAWPGREPWAARTLRLAAHADDLLALLDHLGQRSTVLVGHSMGAFVAALAAARHPDRFPAVVLVDGGLGFPAPAGTDIDEVLTAVIGPAMRKLSMTFPDRDAYLRFHREHPAFAAMWSSDNEADIAAYVDRDLVGGPPELRSSAVPAAVRADGAEVLADPAVLRAIHQLTVPATLLWAERGLLDQTPGLYRAGDPGRRRAGPGADPGGRSARLQPLLDPAGETGGDGGGRRRPPRGPGGLSGTDRRTLRSGGPGRHGDDCRS